MRPSLRLARAKRLVAVQEQMRRIAERDLAATRRQIVQAEADRAGLLRTLAGETMQGLFLDAAASHLRRIAERATALGAKASVEDETARTRGLAEKRVERWADGLAREVRDEEARRDALEQLDLLTARGHAGIADASLRDTSLPDASLP